MLTPPVYLYGKRQLNYLLTRWSVSTVIKLTSFVTRFFVSSRRKERYINGVFYVISKKEIIDRNVRWMERQNIASLAPQWPIHRFGSLSLRNLPNSKNKCDGTPLCCKMKSSPAACSCGNSQSSIICSYEVPVTVFPSKKNCPYTFWKWYGKR